MNQEKRKKIIEKLSRTTENPVTELIYKTPFELLVAVILSAQATDVSVNKATHKLFQVVNTPAQILVLGTEKLKEYINSIGLYNTKAKNILKTCNLLITKHNSKIPNNRKDLEALPGVGRKTANIILNIIFGEPTIAVDTHIFRVCNRTKLAVGKTPLAVEQKLLKVIPKKLLHNAHHLLLLHGRYTCTARKPKCSDCSIYYWCEYDLKSPRPRNKNLYAR